MERAALSVVFSQGRDDELSVLRARVADLERSIESICWLDRMRQAVCECEDSSNYASSSTRSTNCSPGASSSNAPPPVILRYDGTPTTLTLPVWESVKTGTTVTLRLVLFSHDQGDEVTAQLNGTVLKRDLVDPQWKDARIFSPLPQPETVTPGNVVKNLAAQKLTRVEFSVPVDSLKRGPNTLVIAVNRTGPFPASRPVKVEKVELHLK